MTEDEARKQMEEMKVAKPEYMYDDFDFVAFGFASIPVLTLWVLICFMLLAR